MEARNHLAPSSQDLCLIMEQKQHWLVNDLWQVQNGYSATILAFLDLSAAFSSIDHGIFWEYL